MNITRLTITGVVTLIAGAASADEPQTKTAAENETVEIRFNERIRPLLSEHCFKCHGPDSASRKAELRLDVREAAVASGAITPGSVADSELIARITSDDPELMMPPPTAAKRLSLEDKRLLTKWVASGARWEAHWAFIKPRKSELPQSASVEQWARNPIDYFVVAKLRQRGLDPNDAADRYALARRAALDLTGLPPNEDMLQAFIEDQTTLAYERYIDALLASQHAGEHRARYWLDAARYGDTHGMHVDNYREIWPYRDWVTHAFNSNLPFDRFLIEQIAGDLLPRPSLDQRIATGFSRCNITTSEGGAIPKELDVRYMVDRVETTSTVFLGLTAGCAVCHDHKYDPISQREFYQLGAFFNNTTQPAMDGNQKDTPPVVALPKAEFADEWRRLMARRLKLDVELNQRQSHANDQLRKWWASNPPTPEHPIADDELLVWLPLTEGEGEGEGMKLPDTAKWATTHPAGKRGVRYGKGGEMSVAFPQLRSDQPLSVSFWFRTPDQLVSTTVFEQTAQFEEKKTDGGETAHANPAKKPEKKPVKRTIGWKVTIGSQGAVTFEMTDERGKKIRGLLPDNEALRPRTWQHVCVRYSGGQSNSSISILVNGVAASLRNSSEELLEATNLANAPLKIGGRLPTAGLSDVRVYQRWVSNEEVRLLAQDYLLKKTVASHANWNDLPSPDRQRLTHFYNQSLNEDYHTRSRKRSQTQTRRDYIYSRSTTTLVMQERPTPPRAWVLERGEYQRPLEEVTPGVPAVLPPLPDFIPQNRLALAKWLAHPDHPLTARVTINRLWQSVFGVGLVKTSEDFGVMGDRPSHPQLLDWLAVEFVESGWSVNHILKMIVTSAAYRQSSHVTAKKIRLDPDNRFLSRGPRLRLDAEVLRDQALAVGGLLERTIGGPSVRPYQPAGLWKVVAITGSNTRVFQRDSGPALYRRSLYTFWKRTSPPPSMAAFNAPTREQCTVRRERTNTPLQALVLMNDPQYMEAARCLAQNALRRHSQDEQRIAWMLRIVLCRPAGKVDSAEMLQTVTELRAIFKQDLQAANNLIQTGDSAPDPTFDAAELAAWTMAANTLMNRDDFINK